MLKKYSEKEKLSVITQIQQGQSIAQISLETGIARSTIYSWLNQLSMPTTSEGKFITLREVNMIYISVSTLYIEIHVSLNTYIKRAFGKLKTALLKVCLLYTSCG